MSRVGGGIIGPSNIPTKSIASGIWSLNEVQKSKRDFIWPNFSQGSTLRLDFDETTTLDSRITFTRATNGTYFDSSGVLQTASSGVARFDHRLESGVWVNKGLLIEEQKTNLLLRSEEFDNASWAKAASSATANVVDAPDGTTTADKMVESASGAAAHYFISSSTSMTSGVSYTGSVYAKAAERTFVQLTFQGATHGSTYYANFNLSTGEVAQVDTSGVTSTSITDVGDGWYRCSISVPATATATGGLVIVVLSLGTFGRLGVYSGNGSSGIYLWGAQLEPGAFPTSYIKTTTASVTRNADVAVMTSTNFSDWYNATEGTVFTQVSNIADPEDEPSFNTYFQHAISNNTSSERVQLSSSFSSPDRRIGLAVSDGDTLQAFLPIVITYSSTATYKSAYAVKANDFAFSINGGSVSTDTSGTMPTPDRLYLGTSFDGSFSFLNGHIAKFYYWNTRKPDSFLQSITG